MERASHDLKSVITTYEGKHNHDVPAARISSHSSTGPSTAPAALTAHRRSEPPHDGLMLGSGFSLGMGQGLANLGIAGLEPIGQVRMPVLGQFQSYMGEQAGSNGAVFMMPREELKEEPVSETGLSVSNGLAAYHQLLNRFPLGPQL